MDYVLAMYWVLEWYIPKMGKLKFVVLNSFFVVIAYGLSLQYAQHYNIISLITFSFLACRT